MKKAIVGGGLTFLKAVLAGLMIGVGGIVYLSCQSKEVGATLFAVGLFTICVYGMNLYTGKIGYVSLAHFGRDMGNMGLIWLGNLAGTGAAGLLARVIGKPAFLDAADAIAAVKVSAAPLSVIVSGFFCGMLMYIAVNTYRRFADTHPLVGCVAIFLGVVTFILSGFEHCIANMFYLSAGAAWSWDGLVVILCATLGNSLGATVIRQINVLTAWEQKLAKK